MFEALINDPTIFEVTIVLILLVSIAIWQKIKQFAAILGGIQNRRDDTKLYHKWYHQGDLKSKVLLDVGKSFNWRTWSYINVYENRVGEWLLVVEDTLGVRHDSLSFVINSSN